MEPFVTLSQSEYQELLNDSLELQALKEAGVDNWSGFSEAMEIYKEMKSESVANTEIKNRD